MIDFIEENDRSDAAMHVAYMGQSMQLATKHFQRVTTGHGEYMQRKRNIFD